MIGLIQFHDVMSGSAIEMVYDDCLQMYAKVDMLAKQTRGVLIDKLLDLDGTSIPDGKQGKIDINNNN